MPEKPNRTYRRWFQFRLSTWLVLVAIVAWAMALGVRSERTFWVSKSEDFWRSGRQPQPIGFRPTGSIRYSGNRHGWQTQFRSMMPNPKLKYPILALVAFIGWKAFWLVRERRWERANLRA